MELLLPVPQAQLSAPQATYYGSPSVLEHALSLGDPGGTCLVWALLIAAPTQPDLNRVEITVHATSACPLPEQ